jgi:prevent-host-death family protein
MEAMKLDLSADVVPITELIHNTSKYLARIRRGKKSLLVTQNGRAAMVCVEVGEYQRQAERLELMESILAGEKDFTKGAHASWDEFAKKLAKS